MVSHLEKLKKHGVTMMIKYLKNFLSLQALSLCCLSLFAGAALAQEAAEPEAEGSIGRMGDSAVVDVNTYEFSPAERKIWLNDHLQNVEKPARLYYEFVKSGSYEEGFTDAVYLDIIEVNDDGSKNAELEFFTADRQQQASRDNLSNITGNPVIGIYMQGDVIEMNRITDGHWRYFQRRIKMAFSESAEITNVNIDFNGSVVEGEKIAIHPYVKDPRRRDFARFADKSYEFIFSDNIPGSLYQIRTVIPDTSSKASGVLIEETLTLKSYEVKS